MHSAQGWSEGLGGAAVGAPPCGLRRHIGIGIQGKGPVVGTHTTHWSAKARPLWRLGSTGLSQCRLTRAQRTTLTRVRQGEICAVNALRTLLNKTPHQHENKLGRAHQPHLTVGPQCTAKPKVGQDGTEGAQCVCVW